MSVISEFSVGEGIFGIYLSCHLVPFIHFKSLPTFIKPIPHYWIFRLFLDLVIPSIIMTNIFIANYLHVSDRTSLDHIFRNKIIGDFYLFIIQV